MINREPTFHSELEPIGNHNVYYVRTIQTNGIESKMVVKKIEIRVLETNYLNYVLLTKNREFVLNTIIDKINEITTVINFKVKVTITTKEKIYLIKIHNYEVDPFQNIYFIIFYYLNMVCVNGI